MEDEIVPYSERLRFNPDLGECGLPELLETERTLENKIRRFWELFQKSNYIVILSGAGVSTSSGIPDFRGEEGVWTNLKKGKSVFQKDDYHTFETAIPTLTHMSIVKLMEEDLVKYLITQKSGVREKYSELHGNLLKEECEKCGKIYTRSWDVGGMSFKHTGRYCEKNDCGGKLKDMILDWDDPLPEDDLEKSQDECEKADLLICLGTSLRVQPVNGFTELTYKNGGRVVIVNLQETPFDEIAALNIHYYCDVVMQKLLEKLEYEVPIYRQIDKFKVIIKKNGEKMRIRIVNFDSYKCVYMNHVKLKIKRGKETKKVKLNKQLFTYDMEEYERRFVDVIVYFKEFCNCENPFIIKNIKVFERVLDFEVETVNKNFNRKKMKKKRRRVIRRFGKKEKSEEEESESEDEHFQDEDEDFNDDVKNYEIDEDFVMKDEDSD